jgi:hypothetical protein
MYPVKVLTPDELKSRESWKDTVLQRWNAAKGKPADNGKVHSKDAYEQKIKVVSALWVPTMCCIVC